MKILITDGLEAEAISSLRAVHEVDVRELDAPALRETVPSYDALIVRSRTKVTKEVLAVATNLKVVGRAGGGHELCGKTLGLLGSGRIGAEVAKRAQAFGMRVIAHDPYLSLPTAEGLRIALVDKDTLFRPADVLSIPAALTAETRGMVGPVELSQMKRTAILVNCARGEIVQELALADALRAGPIAGAAGA